MNAHKKLFTSPLTPLYCDLFHQKNIKVWIKRDDLNHPTIQGNKWHKLKKNLEKAKALKKTTLLTFGGAYSNHIAATAVAAKDYGFNAIGIIRGEELANQRLEWSKTLKTAEKNGMKLQFINRKQYREKDTTEYINHLQKIYPEAYILPEGGSNTLAILGFEDLMTDINQQCPQWTHLFCPVGTGGTLTGIIHFTEKLKTDAKNQTKSIFGVSVLKQGEYIVPQIKHWLSQVTPKNTKKGFQNSEVSWQLLTQYHDGGYAKQSANGLQQQILFEKEFGILLDPIYTSKMVYAFYDQLKKDLIPSNSNVILLHTGGIQGRH